MTFNSDQFAMFNVSGDDNVKAQMAMASAIESPKFQSAFNVVKGSVLPVPTCRTRISTIAARRA